MPENKCTFHIPMMATGRARPNRFTNHQYMKKALTTREKTIQMLLDRWRKKQDCTEAPITTSVFAQKPRIKVDKARRLP
jgi:hypothetical protein